MRLQHFGDSYDIVKKSLLQWLAPFGPWGAHPMFTEPFSPNDSDAFSKFLGIPLISTEVLTRRTNRASYLRAPATAYRSLLFDPDTGVSLAQPGVSRLLASELAILASDRKDGLILVFDQSLQRGRESASLLAKFEYLREQGVHSFAYASHAYFIVSSIDSVLLGEARKVMLVESGLPANRLVSLCD